MAGNKPEGWERLRAMSPREAFESVRRLAYQAPEGGASERYQELMEEAVRQGLLSWEEIESFEDPGRQ